MLPKCRKTRTAHRDPANDGDRNHAAWPAAVPGCNRSGFHKQPRGSSSNKRFRHWPRQVSVAQEQAAGRKRRNIVRILPNPELRPSSWFRLPQEAAGCSGCESCRLPHPRPVYPPGAAAQEKRHSVPAFGCSLTQPPPRIPPWKHGRVRERNRTAVLRKISSAHVPCPGNWPWGFRFEIRQSAACRCDSPGWRRPWPQNRRHGTPHGPLNEPTDSGTRND